MVKIHAQRGHAAMVLDDDGPRVSQSGQSRVIQQRALHMNGDRVFDDESGEYITIESLLTRFLSALPEAIDHFASL
jgi:hypothetical protein